MTIVRIYPLFSLQETQGYNDYGDTREKLRNFDLENVSVAMFI